jgi:rfaE bifunctional protein nucleotidyltransferase chain/domain
MLGDVTVKRATRPSDLADLVDERAAWRAAGLKVVLTNGCFDLLHAGHLALLEMARGHGDVVVVALNSDASVRGLKGDGRPVVPGDERAEVLLSLDAVDRVVLYDEPTPIAVVRALLPDVLVKGADWAADDIVGRAEVERAGGRVVRVPLVPRRSTSAVIDRIRRP